MELHSWKLTWKPKRGPINATVLLKWGYMSFHVRLGECKFAMNNKNFYPFRSASASKRRNRLATMKRPPDQTAYENNPSRPNVPYTLAIVVP